MKYPALSLWQPWADLLFWCKDVENRSWKLPEKYIGKKILIHAAKKIDKKEHEIANMLYKVHQDVNRLELPFKDLKPLDKFVFGGVIGYVVFDHVYEREDPKNQTLSIWAFNNYHFHISESKRIPFHEIRGQQGIFYIDLPEEYKI